MADEKEAGDQKSDKDGKPKKKPNLLVVGLSLQSLVLLVSVGLIAKAAFFTPRPTFTSASLKERAIASIKDDRDKIQVMDLKDFTINLPSSRIVRANIQLEVSDPETSQSINLRLPAIKYKVINLLSGISVKKIDTFQGKLELKDDLREVINEEISSNGQAKGVVREVFFTDFYLK
jgi:flagellar basal body-associated protein FliL